MDWLTADYNVVFGVAFVMVIAFAVLEGISMILGLGVSEFLSDLLGLDASADAGGHGHVDAGGHADAGGHGGHDLDAGGADADAGGHDAGHDADVSHSAGVTTWLLSWLGIGKVPLLVSLSAFLSAFSISGMTLQETLRFLHAGPWPGWLAAIPAFCFALPVLRICNRLLGRLWPKDETSAFSPDLLTGRVGVVTIGTATAQNTAEVKVTGPDGRPHYVMVLISGEPVSQGGEILLGPRDAAKALYHGRKNENPDFSPTLYS